jgi:hypothetical protein
MKYPKDCKWNKGGYLCEFPVDGFRESIRKCYMLNPKENCEDFLSLKTTEIETPFPEQKETIFGGSGVTDTSKESFKQVIDDGVQLTQRRMVKAFISNNPNICIREISEGTGLQKSSVSARLNELKTDGEVTFTGHKLYRNKNVEMWRV